MCSKKKRGGEEEANVSCWFVLFLQVRAYGSQSEMKNGPAKAGTAGLVLLPMSYANQEEDKSYNINLIHTYS